MKTRSTAAILLGGGFVIGCIDALYAILFWAPYGATPTRIFQSIASGLLGRAAFEGGSATAMLGVALHYFIAFMIVLVYWLASAKLTVLVQRWVLCGAAYGLAVYAVMNYVIMPLSASAPSRFNMSWFIWSVIVHALLVGIPTAFFARVARDGGRRERLHRAGTAGSAQ